MQPGEPTQPGGGPDMQQLMAQAQQMQQQMIQTQEELKAQRIEGSAGNGLVTATVSGVGELQTLEIDPQVVDPQDVETLQDLVVGAVHDAASNAQATAAEKMGPLAGGLGDLGLPGM